eukprot:TRINITY_DN1965_c0_g2_i1.p1 TRINITY_DN1965_c0_g2~~TRINITY_DN1965_c0_g2_i1.p1  ORF type:complete len:621 (+),score=212.63 TRINITY_DN1965_c0_g2_i1:2195-4057(+)
MVFTLLIAADIHGTKTNYEVEFPVQPTIPDLHRKVELVFGTDFVAKAPPGCPGAFVIDRMQIFDERVELWVDLLSSTQLQEFSQIYVFQPETAWHREVQSKLPPAVRAPPQHHHVSSPVAASPSAGMNISGVSPNRSISVASLAHVPVAPIIPVAPSAASILLRSGADASHEEKVSMVFDEMDARKIRAIDLSEFQAFLTNLQFEFSVNTISDLFTKADTNRDGSISYPEFQRFAERYPTLLDAMHYRAREYWQDVRQKEGIEAARRLLESLRAREIDARAASAQAAAETAAQEGRLAAQLQAVAEAEAKEREALAILDASRQETERARAEVAARCAEEQAARDNERMKQLQHIEAQRDVEAAEGRLRLQESEQAQAEDRLREIERLMMEQQRECEMQRMNTQRARGDLSNAQGVEQQAAMISAEASRDVQMAAERVALAKGDLARAQDRERDCTAAHLGAREATAHQRVQKEKEEQELLICREREASKRAIEVESVRAVEAQEAMCRSLEQENMEHAAARAKVQAEEAPLIDQEVKLREQRDHLEQREAALRDEAGAFNIRHTGTRGVASPRSLHYNSPMGAASPLAVQGISPDRSPRRQFGSPISAHGSYNNYLQRKY